MKITVKFAGLALAVLSACSPDPMADISAPSGGGSGGSGSSVPMATGLPNDPFPAFSIDVNSYRAPSLNPLSYNTLLHGAAQTHANDMSTNGFFSHTGSDGSQVWDRATAQGYSWGWIGENIARGQTSAAQALTGWQNSPGHNAILLSSQPTEFALAWAPGNYWVMVLAKPN